jgi:hypothetical protein
MRENKHSVQLKEISEETKLKAEQLKQMLENLDIPEPRRDFIRVKTFYKWYKEEKRLAFNTEYQRSFVWKKNKKKKQLLIDSILKGFDISTIFLRRIPFKETYEVLDGQQRLQTIFEFMEDGFTTPEEMGGLYFTQLPKNLQWDIEKYQIWVVEITTDDDEITSTIFLRLQEGLPLNSAEKLNAMTGFIRNAIIDLSNHRFIKNLGIKDYRFAHRYISAQAYLVTLRNQIIDIKFTNLKELYKSYKTSQPPDNIAITFKKTLNFLDKAFKEDANIIRFKADFISLYLLGKYLVENYVIERKEEKLKDYFIEFLTKVGEVESSGEEVDVPYFDYKQWRKTSADSRKSIEKRNDIVLSKFLEFVPDIQPKDPEREFNYWERLAIYYRAKGFCQICGTKTSFAEGHADHVNPHSKGGPTIVKNGQWLCKKCNLEKSNKNAPK